MGVKIHHLSRLVALLTLFILSVDAHAGNQGVCPAPGHRHMGRGTLYEAPQDLGTKGIDAGKKIAEAACSNCHGKDGISVSDDIPNLAGQDSMYLCISLDAYRIKARNAPVMNEVASKLSDQEIVDLSEYYAHLRNQQKMPNR